MASFQELCFFKNDAACFYLIAFLDYLTFYSIAAYSLYMNYFTYGIFTLTFIAPGPGPALPKLYDFNKGFVLFCSFELTFFNEGILSY